MKGEHRQVLSQVLREYRKLQGICFVERCRPLAFPLSKDEYASYLRRSNAGIAPFFDAMFCCFGAEREQSIEFDETKLPEESLDELWAKGVMGSAVRRWPADRELYAQQRFGADSPEIGSGKIGNEAMRRCVARLLDSVGAAAFDAGTDATVVLPLMEGMLGHLEAALEPVKPRAWEMKHTAISWLGRRREELLSAERFEPAYRRWVTAIPVPSVGADELTQLLGGMRCLEGIAIIQVFGADGLPVSEQTLLQTFGDPALRWRAVLQILDEACCYGQAAVECVLHRPPDFASGADLLLVQADMAMLLHRWLDVSEVESPEVQRDAARFAAHHLVSKTVGRLHANFIAAEQVPATFRKILSALGDASGVSEAVREAFLEGYQQWHEFGRPETIERLRSNRVEDHISNWNYRAWEYSGVDERYIEWLDRVPNLGVH